MEDLDYPGVLAAGFGVASWKQLRTAGMTRTELRAALKNSTLRGVRRGWYATPWADANVVSAVAAGGVLSCLSALRLQKVWVPGTSETVHARARASAHRTPGAQFCQQYGRPESELSSVDELTVAVRHALKCLDDEGIVVVCDSILNKDLLELSDLKTVFRSAPARIRRLLDRCDGAAQSGTESMTRLHLRSRGIGVRTQVDIAGVGFVDMVVGARLIIEVDGYEHRSSKEQFEKDRERDRKAVGLGYIVIRLTYHQVVHEWPAAEESIMDIVRRGEHLKPPVPTTELVSDDT
ncbi:endonuclease domain-containing protein [Gordonia rhizosphera]|uniref:DUF559 domain-containing protein n=1 Tax=Gordonia rhizosphera NBRC 16068 TaxID=1108045 RepID=K6X3W4_9ACTN|nr:DUF559 domain-containing protein [Gordonia rhizosphera]GAB93499.1 hypothetical protein GORHZ_225_00220 [Gordonia rhizosphera NBRC 16068]